MTPTEINSAIAILGIAFGFSIRHVWAYFYLDKGAIRLVATWEKMYNDLKPTIRYQEGLAFKWGFVQGVQMADDEEAEDEEEVTVTLQVYPSIFDIPKTQ